MNAKTALFVALAGFTLYYLGVWWASQREGLLAGVRWPIPEVIGFVTNFFDTLGIGSFATTTALFRRPGIALLLTNVAVAFVLALFLTGEMAQRVAVFAGVVAVGFVALRASLGSWLSFLDRWPSLVGDHLIPGTLNVGHTLPTITQAFIYIAIIDVDMTTLIALIIASVLGAWLGAGVVSSWSAQKVRLGMGIALLAAAALILQKLLIGDPAEIGTDSLTGALLIVGIAGNFVLGALMSLGIGLYAPCMIMVSLLGMNPKLAFPIMMGSCAFLMPVGSARFVRARAFDVQAALGLAFGGLPAVLIAAYIVKELELKYVRWLVVVVVIYTAISMLQAAMKARTEGAAKS